MYINKKPIRRSRIRIYLGKKYYTFKRYLQWYCGKKKYSHIKGQNELKYLVYSHKTPLLRRLRNVDMYLQYNKINNLKIAGSKINKIIVNPMETFSYWKLIGKPTYKKGYFDGLVLCPNGSFNKDVGGGLCQLSNLIYWMALHTPLTVVERYRHSHDVFPDVNRFQPFGSGATCVYNYLDLQIYNNTKSKYQIIVYLKGKYLEGQIRSNNSCVYKYEVYEKNQSITSGYYGGYIRNNSIWRKVYDKRNEIIRDEYITENHAIMMYNPLVK
ncbi:VanW family protein [Haloimpatiens sp. FM7315]|uniref:VanW family protein n=1 Tax=Haloimpatiens sp. FM7315 TaxID=3298609 RepID=UPI0035A37497